MANLSPLRVTNMLAQTVAYFSHFYLLKNSLILIQSKQAFWFPLMVSVFGVRLPVLRWQRIFLCQGHFYSVSQVT